MNEARIAAAVLAAALVAPGAAGADERDEAIFGAAAYEQAGAVAGSADAQGDGGARTGRDEAPSADGDRDDAIFGGTDGAPFGGSDDRDEAMFGDVDGRDDAVFGDAGDRDEAMFGGSTILPTSAPSDRPERPRDGDGLLSATEIDRRLGNAADKVAIGGMIYLRAQYDAYEDQPAEAAPLTSPNLFDLYLDARPNDHLRFYSRARITHRFARPDASSPAALLTGGADVPQTDFAFDQLWMKFDVEEILFVTAGRQPIKWGAGRFWNPTDFLNRTRRDPLAVFDERLGVGLLKLHLPIESSGWNLYAIGDFEGANRLEGIGGAFRVEKLIGDTELSLSTAVHRDQPLRLGADVSFPLWIFDVRAEGAVIHGDETVYFRGVPQVLLDTTPFSREDDWIPQVVVGADVDIPYGDDDYFTLGAEYFYNDAGYDDPRYYPALMVSGSFTPLYLGRHYGAFYASAMGPGRWNDTTLIASVMANLSDQSYLGRFDYRVRLLTYLDVNTFVAWHFGNYGEFRLGKEIPALGASAGLELPPALAQLAEEGGTIPAPTVSAGAGLQLSF